jgi:hypothetical protein
MTAQRTPVKDSKYFVEKETFLTVLHYCRQYPLWLAELDAVGTPIRGISYDKDAVQTSPDYDATAELAMRRTAISRKKDVIDKCARRVAGDLSEWLIMGVSHGLTFYQLYERGMPCSRNTYYSIRRKFYYEMSKLI